MHATNEIVIAAPAHTIYALAAATERWPEILPHYRFVEVLEQSGSSRVVRMAAWRDAIPIAWTAEQTNDPERPHIAFHHVRGWTRGMDVEWIFEPVGDATRVRIEHSLAFRFPIASGWLGDHVVGQFFVRDVAAKTLACMKRIAEAS